MSDSFEPKPEPIYPAPPHATSSSSPYAGPMGGPAMDAGQDSRAQLIGILTLVGAIVAFIVALANLFAAFAVCVTLLTAAYSLAVGIVCLVNALNLMNKPLAQQHPPYASAIMQIVNIISCDVVNLGLGIAILVFLNDPQVRSKFSP